MPTGGGDSTLLTDFPDPDYGATEYHFTPDGQRVVYVFQKDAASRLYLGSSTLSGVRTPLYVPGPSDPPLLNTLDISPDGQWVKYQTDLGNPLQRLHTIPPDGGSATDHGIANFVGMLPDSSRIIQTRFISVTAGTNDLFSAAVSGGDERNLSGLNGAGTIDGTEVSKDGQWIVFRVYVNGRYDLRVSDGNRAQPPTPTPSPTATPPLTPTPMPTTTPSTRNVYLPVVVR